MKYCNFRNWQIKLWTVSIKKMIWKKFEKCKIQKLYRFGFFNAHSIQNHTFLHWIWTFFTPSIILSKFLSCTPYLGSLHILAPKTDASHLSIYTSHLEFQKCDVGKTQMLYFFLSFVSFFVHFSNFINLFTEFSIKNTFCVANSHDLAGVSLALN